MSTAILAINQYRRDVAVFAKISADLAYGLTLVAFSYNGEEVRVTAPSDVMAAKWRTTYPLHHIPLAGGAQVPLHVAVEGGAS